MHSQWLSMKRRSRKRKSKNRRREGRSWRWCSKTYIIISSTRRRGSRLTRQLIICSTQSLSRWWTRLRRCEISMSKKRSWPTILSIKKPCSRESWIKTRRGEKTEGEHSQTRRVSLSVYAESTPSEKLQREKSSFRSVARWPMPQLILMGSAWSTHVQPTTTPRWTKQMPTR